MPKAVDPRRTSREFPADQLAAAEGWLASEIGRIRSGGIHSPATVLVDWTGWWWQHTVERVRSPNTARAYLYALRLLADLDRVRLADLRPAHLQAVASGLGGRVGPANIQNVVGVWRRCLASAVKNRLIADNPADGLVVPQAPRRPDGRERGWTAKEVAVLREAIAGHRFEVAYALLLGCGLRLGEVLGLHWANVDLAGHRAWIQDQYTNGHWRPLPKGRNPHWVTLPDFVVAALIRRRDELPPGTRLVMQGNHRPDCPWSSDSVRSDLVALLETIPVRKLPPHAGRHALATYLLDGGVPITTISLMLGHADAGITMRTYVSATDAGRERADALVNDLFPVPSEDAPDPES
jgi:integrase